MKKIFSLILCLCMICSFTGCSMAENRFFTLYDEITKLDCFDFHSDVEIKLSFDSSNELIKIVNEEMEIELKPFENIKLGIDGKVNVDKSYMNLIFNLEEATNGINTSTSVVFTEGGIFISKESLLNLYSFYLDTTTVFTSETIGTIISKLNEEIKEVNYICIDTVNVFSELRYFEDVETIEDVANIKIEDRAILDVLQLIFSKDFMSKLDLELVEKVNNEYVLTIKSEEVVNIVKSYLDYLVDNLDNVENTLLSDERLNNMFGSIANTEEGAKEVNEKASSYHKTVLDIIDGLEDLNIALEDEETNKVITDNFGIITGSELSIKLGKTDNGYSEEEKLVLVYNGVSYADVIVKTNINKNYIEPKIVVGSPIEDFVTSATKISYMVNPAEIIEAQWHANSSEYLNDIYMEVGRREGTEDIISSYILVEDRLYLPLRQICETFGEEVVWDSINNKAYVVRGSERIDMTGMIIEGRTYLRIRDFEKLNYKIDYVGGQEYNSVTIVKN